nr:MAG TPA: hypothetical protein [Caudoviricetes sp.]DAX79681.1 MAG TPA: hypothetical protein [Caudoviricetes sp.]
MILSNASNIVKSTFLKNLQKYFTQKCNFFKKTIDKNNTFV